MFCPLRRFTFLILATMLLVACATPEERELKRLSDASELLWAQYDDCAVHATSSTASRRLDRVFILTREDPRSVHKMTIDRYASDQEKSDLLEYKNIMSYCQHNLFYGFTEINPGFSTLLARFVSEDDELLLQTIQNEITIGERNVIVNQRFAKRLGDWYYAAERIVRLYTGQLRRRCWYHCESLVAVSLVPPSAGAMSNIATAPPVSRVALGEVDKNSALVPQERNTAKPAPASAISVDSRRPHGIHASGSD